MGFEKRDTTEIDNMLQRELPDEEGGIVVGWVIAYEVANVDGQRAAGFLREGSASTPWQAVGLLQWAGAAIMSNAMGRGE